MPVLVAAVEIGENLLRLSASQNYPGRPPLSDSIGRVIWLRLALLAVSVASLVGLTIVAWMDGRRAATPVNQPSGEARVAAGKTAMA